MSAGRFVPADDARNVWPPFAKLFANAFGKAGGNACRDDPCSTFE
jgi:hypothetical protein